MADIQKQNEKLLREVARLKEQAALKEQNEALQKEVLRLRKAAAVQCKPLPEAPAVSCWTVTEQATR